MPGKNRARIGVLGGLTLCLTILGLAGCEEYRSRGDSVVSEHGNAVAHNIAVQTIDPWPPASRNTQINVDGERALTGIQNYKASKTPEPKGLSTQKVSTESGRSGSSGGSQ